MTDPRYIADERSERDARRALARAARTIALPDSLQPLEGQRLTWGDLLFAGDDVRRNTEASQALLASVGRLLSNESEIGMARHFNQLPGRLLQWYYEERLGIGRLPPRPDRVVLVAEGDAKRLPASLPAGSMVEAGMDVRGAPRRYATTDQLTVLGAELRGLHSHRVLDDVDLIVRREGEEAAEPAAPYHPFGTPGGRRAELAPHELYVASRLLEATGGQLTATLLFEGVDDSVAAAALLDSLAWEVPGDDGYRAVDATAAARPNARAAEVQIELAGGIPRAPAGDFHLPHLRARFPDHPDGIPPEGFSRSAAFAFAFTGLTLSVSGRGLTPEAGLYNAGVLDLTKEFEPFGPVPRRGDAFYLHLNEAFAKPLRELRVNLELIERETEQAQPQFISIAYFIWPGPGGGSTTGADAASRIVWQAYREGRWRDEFERSDFASLDEDGIPDYGVFSERHTVGGVSAHFIRAFLFRGDFGWEDYLDEMASNATLIAQGEGSSIDAIRPPPDPPIVTRVTVDYSTHARSLDDADGDVVLLARNALGAPQRLVATGDALVPFVERPDGTRAALYLGLAGVPPGEVAALFLDIEEASTCGAIAEDDRLAWEYRGAEGEWHELDVGDGTLGLRQSGIVRVRTRAGWAAGAPEVDQREGRWIRVRAAVPELAGHIRHIALDAVEAAYVIPPAHALDDPTPDVPIEAEAAKGPRAAIPGVKKLTNPVASSGGRGPEPDARYFDRAAQVTRHRNRAISAWDVEAIVQAEFPEVAKARCLPHRSYDSERAPGWFAVAVVPRSRDRRPQPSVRLAADIRRLLGGRASSGLRIAVLCAVYEPVSLFARIQLRPGFGATPARDAVDMAIRDYLHPLAEQRRRGGFGRGLTLSEIARLIEDRPEVDFIREIRFRGPHAELEYIPVDSQLGLIASADDHALYVEATL